ncbi:MAG: MgtC/SapB family protein [Firmicutes bacterium]|nr:MgtC/SapB family protein [Bacillota bacterium]
MNHLLNEDMVIRLFLAVLAGTVMGYPHARYIKSATRIYAIVCLGSALVMLVSTWGFADLTPWINFDPARLSAQVIAGMGFVGAGIIIIRQGRVYGLPASATLWLTASIGLVIGLGWYFMAILAVFASWGTFLVYPLMKKLLRLRRRKARELRGE